MKKEYSFLQSIPMAIRIWHWLNSLLISLLLITVVIGFFFLKTRINVPIIIDELSKQGITIPENAAKSVAKRIGEPIWQWHTYFGYALSALLIFRIGYEFYTKRKNRIFTKLEGWKSLFKSPSKLKSFHKHYLWVKLIYLVFYLSISLMMISGLLLAFNKEISLPKDVKSIIKDFHYCTMYAIVAFIAAHISGLLRAESTDYKGIVSGMIHGNN